jgi:uncharacterized membrane protein
MTEWYFNPVGNYWLVGCIALGLLALLVFVGAPAASLTRGQRTSLFVLRAAVLVLLMLALLRPTLMATIVKKQAATLVVLVDRSRSMQVTDAVNGASRWQTLLATLRDAVEPLAQLEPDINVKGYAFDAELGLLEYDQGRFKLEDTPQGAETAIGAALEETLRREAGERLVGVLLLSDGAQRAYAPRDTPPQTVARRLANLGYPLYAFAFGQARGAGQARDVAIKDLIVNQSVFVKNELTVSGTLRAEGFANQKLLVRLLYETPGGKMEIVATQEVEIHGDGQATPIAMSYVPTTPGEYKVTLDTPSLPGELVTTNNHLSTFVTVLAGGLNVLYLEGDLRVEQKFLRRSLDASPDIKVDYLRLDARDRAAHPLDLRPLFEHGVYDAYLLGDIDSSVFKPDELLALADAVRHGAGMIMLGGFRTFGPGGYGATPLADLLPINMTALERLRPDDPLSARNDLQIPGPLAMRPAHPLGMRHYIMALAPPATNEEVWEKLPPLEGATKWSRLKPTAQVLAETPDGRPLLVAQEAGGRVIAFAGDTTWHWWMQGHEAEHKRFWRQIVLWLAHKDNQNQNNVWVRFGQRRYSPGSRVEFTAGAETPQGDPALDATLRAEVVRPDGARRATALSRQGEQMIGAYSDTQLAGDYAVEVSAAGPSANGSTRARFLIYEQDLELDNPAADPTLLASLARTTSQAGGQLLAPEELPALIERIRKQPPELETQTQEKQSPWDTWEFFLTFVSLLCTEWLLRKRWGLV